ncbi:MAG TPA: cell division protein FtsL [Methylotenera sp.]|nr:cell division protein FtsL [Methylotenera sp.]
MTRLNLILFFALIFSGLGLVNSQHKARKLYIELEQINDAAKQYDQEYGQLQLEQSTWAMHSRVELIASQRLQMQVPDATRVQVVTPNDGSIQIVAPQSQLQVLPKVELVSATKALNAKTFVITGVKP